jgi:6-phosphogluconolactonase
LKDYVGQIQFDKWRIAFVDERVVPLDHPDSNYKACTEQFFSRVGIEDGQVLAIDSFDDAEDAALRYEDALIRFYETDRLQLDLAVLGMGPDGHTASLFPGHELLSYSGSRQVLSINESPKPPPQRITLSLGALNQSSTVLFIATGAAKLEALKSVLGRPINSGVLSDEQADCASRTVTSYSDRHPAGMIR